MCKNSQKTNGTKESYYLAGIGSRSVFKNYNPVPQMPSVFTDVSQFVAWIETTSASELVIFLTKKLNFIKPEVKGVLKMPINLYFIFQNVRKQFLSNYCLIPRVFGA